MPEAFAVVGAFAAALAIALGGDGISADGAGAAAHGLERGQRAADHVRRVHADCGVVRR